MCVCVYICLFICLYVRLYFCLEVKYVAEITHTPLHKSFCQVPIARRSLADDKLRTLLCVKIQSIAS